MKFHVFGLLLCITISVNGKEGCTFNGSRCFIGGYQYFPKIGYYKLYTAKASWNDAWKQCRDDGSQLVVINSREEYEVITEMQRVGGDIVLVGIHDLFKEGIFVTLTGEYFIPSEYLTWNEGEPNNAHGNENCAALLTNALLNDVPCSSTHQFICEHIQSPSHPLIPK